MVQSCFLQLKVYKAFVGEDSRPGHSFPGADDKSGLLLQMPSTR